MARQSRLKIEGESAWYHLYSAVACRRGTYPLAEPACQKELMRLMEHYSGIYFCEIAAVQVLGNHYHVVCKFEEARAVTRDELWGLALKMYPRSEIKLKAWTEAQWERFERRLFNVSEFMRNLQAAFATWYNRTYDRKGRFWAERFKSALLADAEAVLDCILYVELNAVRASLVERPEDYAGGSMYLREIGKGGWLADLEQFLECGGQDDAFEVFRRLVYHRGAIPTRAGQAAISPEVLAAECARGFKSSGVFRKRFRHFTDGLVVGGAVVVRQMLTKLKEAGRYVRRKHPVPHADGASYSAREQRSHFVAMR